MGFRNAWIEKAEKVKQRIIAGKIIDLPYLTLQKDRRLTGEKGIDNERRKQA